MNDFDIIEFLKEIVDNIRETALITGYVDNADGTYTINTPDTGSFAIDDNRNIGVELVDADTLTGKFLISAIVPDTSITISKKYSVDYGLQDIEIGLTPDITEAYWKSLTPTFWHGEVELLNQKLDNYTQNLNFYPAILVVEPLAYQLIENDERNGLLNMQFNNLPIAFLDYIGYAENDITKDDFRNLAIIPMTQLALLFLAELKAYNSDENYINVRQIIRATFDEIKNDPKYDFSPTGIGTTISILLENVYNICQ